MKKFIASARRSAAVLILAASAAFSFANPADEARAAVQKQFDALAKGDVKSVYLALPASYQKDVANIVKAFAGKVDADIYKGVGEVLVAIADLGDAQAEMLAKALAENDPTAPKAADIKTAAAALKGLVGKLDLDTLKKGDIPAILAYPEVTALAKLAKSAIPEVKITDAKLNDDGSVSISIEDGNTDAKFSKIEGAWVPEDISDGWKNGVKSALEEISKFKADENKQKILDAVPIVKMAFNNAKSAKTPEQLSERLMMSLFPLMMMFSME